MEGFVLDAARVAREKARGVWPDCVATDYLDRWAAEKPQASALVAWRLDEESETRLSWAELALWVARFARTLKRKGVGAGDEIGRASCRERV